jgi:hypothetical protein
MPALSKSTRISSCVLKARTDSTFTVFQNYVLRIQTKLFFPKVLDFQEHLIATMMALEDTYFSMAEKCDQERQHVHTARDYLSL